MTDMGFGVFALAPPLITIVAAFITKQVMLSLFIGIFAAATMLAGFNPGVGLVDTFRRFVFPSLGSNFNASVITMTFLVGAFSIMIERGGGAHAFAEALKGKVRTRKRGEIATWLGSFVIFFSDSSSPVVVGPVFKPITDRLKISREKLAYIVDSTTCTMPVMVPFSAWGAFIMGIIAAQFDLMGYDGNPLLYHVASIPYQLYPIAAIIMVFIIAASGFDYGPMIKAEKRALYEGKLYRDGANLLKPDFHAQIPEGARPTIWNMLLPIIVLLSTIFFLFLYTGGFFEGGITVGQAMQGASAMPALNVAFFLASWIAVFLAVKAKVFTLREASKTWFDGMKSMTEANLILVLAWGIGSASSAVGAPAFIVSATYGFLTPTMLYVAVFIAASFTSFSTGTSWGTFAIFLPITIPLAYAIGAPIAPAIAVALSGGIFGDHCSPVSDTTVLSSMGSSCDLMDHVITQLPYALTAALAATLGYLVVGFTGSAAGGLATMLVSLTFLAFLLNKFWGTKVEERAAVAK